MTEGRLRQILGNFPNVRVLVVGDFFLDKYLVIDRRLSEKSLETGLEAFQVVEKRPSPGAAGTVTNNLRALGVGTVYALGVVGDDGEGYELRKGLERTGVITDHIIVREDLFTPTYTKPMIREPDGREWETNRLDIKNRKPLPKEVEAEVIRRLRGLVPEVDGVIVADQVQERNCGVITDRVREELARLAERYPEKVFYADSRERIGEFRNLMIKPNRFEAAKAVSPGFEGDVPLDKAVEFGRALYERNRRPVFVTVGEEGILVFTEGGVYHIPGVKVTGEIDIVGAGDSVTGGLVPSLCSGASPVEAAVVGNLVASITIQQIGTTGTASPEQVVRRFKEWEGVFGRPDEAFKIAEL